MKYIIDIVTLEYWTPYATARHKEWAQDIANMLLAQGKTVRISEDTTERILGEAQTPNDSSSATLLTSNDTNNFEN